METEPTQSNFRKLKPYYNRDDPEPAPAETPGPEPQPTPTQTLKPDEILETFKDLKSVEPKRTKPITFRPTQKNFKYLSMLKNKSKYINLALSDYGKDEDD